MDCVDCGFAGGGGASRKSNGLLEAFGGDFSRVRSIDIPAVGLIGDLDRLVAEPSVVFENTWDPFPSPSRTRVSIDFSKFPPRPFKTALFLFSSLNPISRNFAIFTSMSSSPSAA